MECVDPALEAKHKKEMLDKRKEGRDLRLQLLQNRKEMRKAMTGL